MKEQPLYEEEIDLKEILLTLLKHKLFIALFTALAVGVAAVYVALKKPIYEAEAVLEIGNYRILVDRSGTHRIQYDIVFTYVDDMTRLIQNLKTIFMPKSSAKEQEAWVEKISRTKDGGNFLEISTNAFSRDLAAQKLQTVIDYIALNHQKILDQVFLQQKLILQDLQIDIDTLKNIQIATLDNNISYFEKKYLPLAEEKLKFLDASIKKTEKNIAETDKDILKTQNSNPSLAAISTIKKSNLEMELLELKLKQTETMEAKERAIKVQIPSLKQEKERLVTADLQSLLNKKTLRQKYLELENFVNTKIVGEIVVPEKPVKPRKALIIVVSLLSGFVMAVFLVFVKEFLKTLKDKNKLKA
ncbi:MAG: GNVR domain-containing protein [Helicobacteraceae bacterium]